MGSIAASVSQLFAQLFRASILYAFCIDFSCIFRHPEPVKSCSRPSGSLTLYAPRLPADPFARSAVSPQRNLLAAQSPRSAVSIIPSKPGRAPGVGQGPQKKGPGAQGRPGGPGGGARCARARADARFARGGPSGPGPLRGPGGPLIRNKSYAERNR